MIRILLHFLLLSLNILGWSVSSEALADPSCDPIRLIPDQNTRAQQSVVVSEKCDLNEKYRCSGGVIVYSKSPAVDGRVSLSVNCYSPDSPLIPKDNSGSRVVLKPRTIGPHSNRIRTALRKNSPIVDAKTLKAKSLQAGIPEVVFDRAFKNYEELKKKGDTKRGCFMAVDLTTSATSTNWIICASPDFSIRKLPGHFGSGQGSRCQEHMFKNDRGCARFFGNRPGHCLPAGGRYVTNVATKDVGSSRPLIELTGLDKDENDNAKERRVGIHQEVFHNGKPYLDQTNFFEYSQGCFTLPAELPGFHITDLSSDTSGGGLAVYVYPSREDIIQAREKGRAPYWDAKCEAQIGKPGWLGTKDSSAPSVKEMQEEQLKQAMETGEELEPVDPAVKIPDEIVPGIR